jgi:hypothetical protein
LRAEGLGAAGFRAFPIVGLAAAIILAAVAGSAHAQWTVQQVPLGQGWYSNQITGPNGQFATGTTMPLGGGFSTTTCH